MKTDKVLLKSLTLKSDVKPVVSRITTWSKYENSGGEFKNKLKVVNSDIITEILNQQNRRALALIFASAKSPGGGVRRGAVAQEEVFCAVSNALPLLEACEDFYKDNKKTKSKVYLDDALVISNVTMFFDKYGVRTNNELVDAIFYPAPNRALCDKKSANDALNRRIKNIIEYSNYHGYDSLIVGEWGTGVFGNDVGDVASAFKDNIANYGGGLDILFTVYNSNNLEYYKNVFKGLL